MEKNSAEEFLAVFNKTEKWMKKTIGARDEDGYISVLKKIKNKNSIIKRYFDELQLYATLRNLMIHEKINPNYYVAHPSPEIVEKFNNIYNELTKPELLIPRFMREVVRFNIDDPLSLVLEEVKTKKYTNFPVYSPNGEFKGLLTDNGITNWLSYNVEDDHLLLSTIETSIGDVMSLEEEKNNYIFIGRKKSIYDAKDIFEKNSNRIDAMLITENGEENESLLGIITAWDILDNSHQ